VRLERVGPSSHPRRSDPDGVGHEGFWAVVADSIAAKSSEYNRYEELIPQIGSKLPSWSPRSCRLFRRPSVGIEGL
jgi:hypothetical protein